MCSVLSLCLRALFTPGLLLACLRSLALSPVGNNAQAEVPAPAVRAFVLARRAHNQFVFNIRRARNAFLSQSQRSSSSSVATAAAAAAVAVETSQSAHRVRAVISLR